MPIQGLRDTSNFATNERPENWRAGYLLLYPNGKTPLTALTSAMKERSVDDPVFHWWEKSLDDRRMALHATSGDLDAPAAGSIQTLTLEATANAITLKANDVLWVEQTDEKLRVYADPTSNTSVTVVRGFEGTTPVAVDANGLGVNPNLTVIGSAFEQGSLAPTGINFDPTERSNNTQIFRSTMEITRTAAKTRLRTVDAVKEARRECLEYINVDMERAFWFGNKSVGSLNGKPIYTTAGIYNLMSSGNIFTATGGIVDMDLLDVRMELLFREGSNEKMAFCGNKFLSTLNTVVRKNTSYHWKGGEKEFGMEVTRLVCPFGTVVFKTHPLFTQMSGGTTTGVDYYGMNTGAFILDMSEIQYVYLRESDLKYEGDLQAIGQDAMKAGYIAECGIELHHPSTHHLWKGFNTGREDI